MENQGQKSKDMTVKQNKKLQLKKESCVVKEINKLSSYVYPCAYRAQKCRFRSKNLINFLCLLAVMPEICRLDASYATSS